MGRRLGGQCRRLVAAFLTAAMGAAVSACDSSGAGSPATDASLDAPREVGAPREASMDAPTPLDGGAVGGHPTVSIDATSLSFPALSCGGGAAALPLHLTNVGGGHLAVSATAVGGFAVTPSVVQLAPGATAALAVSAAAPASAGTSLTGSLELFTNDPSSPHVAVALSATPRGATLAVGATSARAFAFPQTELRHPAPPQSVTLTNTGNAVATFRIAPPSDPHFTLLGATGAAGGLDGGSQTIMLGPGDNFILSAEFTPTDTSPVMAVSTITTSDVTCGSSLPSLAFTGSGALGVVTGWPTSVDFGPASCGGSPPPSQSFVLSNTGSVDAVISAVRIVGAPGFATDEKVGRTIVAGGSQTVTVTAPAVASLAPLAPVTASLAIQTDADPIAHTIVLTEEPSGAVLAFDTSPTPGFGSFGPVVLLRSASAAFRVANTGNAPANVTLSASAADGSDAAAPSGVFTVSSPAFAIAAGAAQDEMLTFTPASAPVVTGRLSLSATGPLCGALPSALPLTGSGVGGALTVTPSSVAFGALCGGPAPSPGSFLVRNDGDADLTWSIDGVSGPGADHYRVQSSPAPGLLAPGGSAVVTVAAAPVAAPAVDVSPPAYAAQVQISTDVPRDPAHIVTLSETPLGDQLAFDVPSPLRFGQVPVGTSVSETFAIINSANPGSPPASLSLAVGGPGASAFALAPPSVSGLLPGGHVSGDELVAFSPSSSTPYAASVAIATSDALCTPLPPALALTGTGTQGRVELSATTLSFGTDPADPAGLVDCGAIGLPHDLTIRNVGNQALQITGLSLRLAAMSPFKLSGPFASLPVELGIGQSLTLTITPGPIPAYVPAPGDPTPFTDALTITTDASPAPAVVSLVMQARGAVIADTPLPTSWDFGTVTAGSIATFTSTVRNVGNAPATVSLRGLAQPAIFGLSENPTTAAAGQVTSLVGQFTPPSASGAWTDQGVLAVSSSQALCAPLPAAWSAPTIHLSGTSDASPAVTVSGSLAFPRSECGSAAPAGQVITLTNGGNAALGFTARLSAGAFYTLSSSSGTLPGSGTGSIVVTPRTLTPGPGVLPGSSAYADNLLVTVATAPPTAFTVPVSWTLDGAVLTLPESAGPNVDAKGDAFYLADSTSGFSLPLGNTGTGAATVTFAIQPQGAFALTPVPPISVLPGLGASPQLVAGASAPACPSTLAGTATFLYAGPVCQPLPLPSVSVRACSGTY